MRVYRLLPLLVIVMVMLMALPASAAGTITLVSHNSAGTAAANGVSTPQGGLTSNGDVVFTSSGTNLVAGVTDANGGNDVFIYDHSTGAIKLVSHPNGSALTAGNGASTAEFVSPDG